MLLWLALAGGVCANAEAEYEDWEYALVVFLVPAVGEVRRDEGNAPGIALVERSEGGRLWFEIGGEDVVGVVGRTEFCGGGEDLLGVMGRTGFCGGGDGGGGGMDVPAVKDSERDSGRPGSWKEEGPRLTWFDVVVW